MGEIEVQQKAIMVNFTFLIKAKYLHQLESGLAASNRKPEIVVG